MKKALASMAAMILALGMLCTGALAAGGRQGGTPQGNGDQGGGQISGQGGMPGDQNGQMGGGQPGIPPYGRYLDMDKVVSAIALMTDADAAASLTAFLQAYRAAVPKQDDSAVQEALQALLIAMNQTQAQEQPQTQPQDQSSVQGMDMGMGSMNAQLYSYLDTDAVASAITMTDSATAATLNGLLQAYSAALASDDPQALQRAFADLMEALAQAEL